MIYRSGSARDTRKFAEAFAGRLKTNYKPGRKALLIALRGDLGAGKTVFSKGFLSGFGVKKVTSPTFVIMKRYGIKGAVFKNLYHFDCYRLNNPSELETLGIASIIKDPGNIILMEWPEKAGLYGRGSSVALKLGEKENERTISVTDKKIKKILAS